MLNSLPLLLSFVGLSHKCGLSVKQEWRVLQTLRGHQPGWPVDMHSLDMLLEEVRLDRDRYV